MKDNSVKAFNATFVLLLLLFIFHLVNNIIVINLNNAPLVYDAYENYHNAKLYVFTSQINSYRPPLISFLSLPIFKLFGPSQKAVSFGIGIYSLFAVCFITYLLGKQLYSKEVGLLSAFILSSLPIIFGHSRTCMSDLLLASWVTFSILFMTQPRVFISLKFIISFGIVIGLGMLTRISYPLYFLGPFIYMIIKSAKENLKTYRNLFLIILVAFSTCAFWYLPNVLKTADEYIKIGQFHLSYLSSDIFFYYLFDTLLRDWLGVLCIIFFFLALTRADKIRQSSRILFLIWIIVPYFVLSFIDFQNPRFIIPILPALAIISSSYILNIKKIFYRRAVIMFIVVLGMAQVIFISYSPLARKAYGFLEEPYDEWSLQSFGLLQPARQNWKLSEICNTIKTIAPEAKRDTVFVKVRPLVSDGIREKCDLNVLLSHLELCCMNLKRGEFHDNSLLFSKLEEADIVIKAENPSENDEGCENDNNLDELFKKNIHKFSLVNSIALPDGSRLLIYKRKNPR